MVMVEIQHDRFLIKLALIRIHDVMMMNADTWLETLQNVPCVIFSLWPGMTRINKENIARTKLVKYTEIYFLHL